MKEILIGLSVFVGAGLVLIILPRLIGQLVFWILYGEYEPDPIEDWQVGMFVIIMLGILGCLSWLLGAEILEKL